MSYSKDLFIEAQQQDAVEDFRKIHQEQAVCFAYMEDKQASFHMMAEQGEAFLRAIPNRTKTKNQHHD